MPLTGLAQKPLRDQTERKPVRGGSVSHPVARQKQPLLLAVPDSEREHSVEALQSGCPVERALVQQNLGIRMSAESASPPFQFCAQLEVVVDFPVINDLIASRSNRHGLRSAGGINDAQAAMSQSNAGFHMKAFAVRPAWRQPSGHTADQLTGFDAGIVQPCKSCNSTHGFTLV